MVDFILDYYDYIKALHLIAVISWVAGLLYLPRLFVYHVENPQNETHNMLCIMEYRLLKYIMNPAMIVTWLLGITMLISYDSAMMTQGWLHLKLLCVVLMTLIHHILGRHRKAFAVQKNNKNSRYFRILNEVPTVLMIIIVIVVIVKPF
jgi:putative membrane protein